MTMRFELVLEKFYSNQIGLLPIFFMRTQFLPPHSLNFTLVTNLQDKHHFITFLSCQCHAFRIFYFYFAFQCKKNRTLDIHTLNQTHVVFISLFLLACLLWDIFKKNIQTKYWYSAEIEEILVQNTKTQQKKSNIHEFLFFLYTYSTWI